MNIRELFQNIMGEYITKRKEETCNSQSTMYQLVVKDAKSIIEDTINEINNLNIDINVKSSCGKGAWTYYPWIAIFNPKITSTIQEGVYVVYLFSEDMQRVYLTLNQGFTNLQKELGSKRSTEEMIKRRSYLKNTLDRLDFKYDNNLKIGKKEYEEGCIFYREYKVESLPSNDIIISDLTKMINIYKEYYYKIFLLENEPAKFISDLKMTRMNKSYKIPLLQSLYNDGNIKSKVDKDDIYIAFKSYYDNEEHRVDIVDDNDISNYENWSINKFFSKAKNPIDALCNSMSQYFEYKDGIFYFSDIIKPSINSDGFKVEFKKAIEELESKYFNRDISAHKDGNIEEEGITGMVLKEVVDNIQNYIKNEGYTYTYEDLSNLYISLKTKPFVILAGISGTGKSKIVRLFGEAIGATPENKQMNMISVRPDWNDSSDLIGYKNLKDQFIEGQLTKVILEASKAENKNKPYFICMDEMNLARVEYYLSDYLSIIESRRKNGQEIITDSIIEDPNLQHGKITIPDNLYLVGTVNMDDTTFQFSRKVLDRANTIEFSDVDLENLFPQTSEEEIEALKIDNSFLKTSYLKTTDIEEEYREYAILINEEIIKINEILKKSQKQFAYRVRDEILFYMVENKKTELLHEDLAFDYQIMQKILPAITGSESSVADVLIDLFNYVCNTKVIDTVDRISIEEAQKYLTDNNIRYTNSAKKILFMLKGYNNDGYVSYWY